MMKYNTLVIALSMTMIIVSCSEKGGPLNTTGKPSGNEFVALERITSDQSGIDFSNEITTNERINTITFDNLVIGSGVGVLDIDNDGKMDLFFGGGMDDDRLYLNKGNLQFEDITEGSGIRSKGNWTTGVAVADVNQDGYDDIYVCKFLYNDQNLRKNHLYINQKDNTFKESADEYGLADPGYTIMASFLDYDNDGDLDLYVANQPPSEVALKQQMGNKIYYAFTDRLYRNDGGKKFTNVTGEAELTNFSYTLSTSIWDYNQDGLLDIYLCNDYEEPDALLVNDGDGTFTNTIDDAMRHISNFSMGSDISDINRDGQLDIYTADMAAEDSYRQKVNMSGMNPARFWELANNGFHYQYMYNAMQINNGVGQFSEIGHMSGISSTDWSWAPVFLDFDMDGYDDLLVTNGIMREVRHKDHLSYVAQEMNRIKEEEGRNPTPAEILALADETPSVKVLNALYRNNGDMTFDHYEDKWGVNDKSWSQAAAYADLDNDGDMEIIISNTNEEVFLYKNNAVEQSGNNYINIRLKGEKGNPRGMGAKVLVYADGKEYYNEMSPYRGYMTTHEPVITYGLGGTANIDSVVVYWLTGKKSILTGVRPNQDLDIDIAKAVSGKYSPSKESPMFMKKEGQGTMVYMEDEHDDYQDEVLLPHKMSTLGPFIATGDVNGDGNDDYFLSGSAGSCGQLFIYDPSSDDFISGEGPWCQDKAMEDGGVLFHDLDGDEDLDLIVTSGGNQFAEGNIGYADRLYRNDGGRFTKVSSFKTPMISSGPVVAFDYDNDGDEDLFIGGRQIPERYGYAPGSVIMRNDGGLKFTDVTSDIGDLDALGMVTAATWTDLNGDGANEMIVVGEWMPITVLAMEGGKLVNKTQEWGLEKTGGWWNTIYSYDVDGDDQEELLLGNLGLNIKYKATPDKPFKAFVDDFDENGSNDVYLGQAYRDGNYYPVRGRQCSSEQMPYIKKQFKNYEEFAVAKFEDVLGERVEETTVLNEAHVFESSVLDFDAGKANLVKLPSYAQIAPIFEFAAVDVDGDGKDEVIAAGNYYNREVETTRSDAGYGVVIDMHNGKVSTEVLAKYGIDASGDVRALKVIQTKDAKMILVGVNNDKVRLYKEGRPKALDM